MRTLKVGSQVPANRLKQFFTVRALALTASMLLFGISSGMASLSNVYIAQSAAGGNTGADCADAHAVSFFNTALNWGTGAAQIGPGTTVHLCGAFSFGVNTGGLTIQGSGATANPITILFESGAILQSPAFNGDYFVSGGGIFCNGFNYITIDGGTNGMIRDTANGTLLANQQASAALNFNNCSHTEVRNMNISNMYVRNGTASDGGGTSGIMYSGSSDAMSIHDNTISSAEAAIFIGYQTLTSATIYNNRTDHHKWAIAILDNGATSAAANVNIYNNNCGPHYDEWGDTAQNFHLDGIFLSSQNGTVPSGSTFVNSNVYNNYVHGDMGANGFSNSTGYLYLSGASGGMSHINVYNNVFVQETTGWNPEGDIVLGGTGGVMPSNIGIYNNTFVGVANQSVAIEMRDGLPAAGETLQNNIFSNMNIAINVFPNTFSMIAASNHNVFSNLSQLADRNGGSGPPVYYNTLSAWQANGFDGASSSGAPNLDANFKPQSGSAAIGLGTNLTNLGISLLDSDKAGVPRPPSAAWDAGAYQHASSGAPTPPTGLTATVH